MPSTTIETIGFEQDHFHMVMLIPRKKCHCLCDSSTKNPIVVTTQQKEREDL
jgi:hypothetical protein